MVLLVQKSSPVTSNTDLTELLYEYVDWHIQKVPRYERQFKKALDTLDKECLNIEYVWSFSEAKWMDLMILLGIADRLSKEVRDFLATQAKRQEDPVYRASQALIVLQDDSDDALAECARAAIKPITP